MLRRAAAFTETFELCRHELPAIREARCLEVYFEHCFLPLREGDVLAGRYCEPLVGISAEAVGVGFFANLDALRDRACDAEATSGDLTVARHLLAFWTEHRTNAMVRRAYPAAVASGLPSDRLYDESGVAFSLYRIAGATLDFATLCRLGLPGLRAAAQGVHDSEFREGVVRALAALEYVVRRYADEAASFADHPACVILSALLERPPKTLHEVVQLVWLYMLASGARNLGRLDVVLGPLLSADLASGRLASEAQAEILIEDLWQRIAERRTVFNGRVILGGDGRLDRESADCFARLSLKVTRRLKLTEPQVSLRLGKSQDPEFLQLGLDAIAEGGTYPNM